MSAATGSSQRPDRSRRRDPKDREELLDGDALPFRETERSLADLGRMHRLLLGGLSLHRALVPRLRREPQRVLDLGTGSGVAAAALARASARRGADLTVVGCDRQLRHLVVGRCLGLHQLRVVGDASALPFRDGTFSWSFSTLFFHHFDADGNRRVIAEMRRVSRLGAAIVDLRRSPLLAIALRLVQPLLRTSAVTRHDGRISVARSWTVGEVARLVAGLPVLELRRRFPFRFSLLVGAPDGSGADASPPA